MVVQKYFSLLGTLFAIAYHFQHSHPLHRQHFYAVHKLLDIANQSMLYAIGFAQRRELYQLRRGKILFKIVFWCCIELSDGQHFKNAATVVINNNNGKMPGELSRVEQSVRVVQKG